MKPKQKQCPVVDVCNGESKVRCCKEQCCIGIWNVRSMNQGRLEAVKQEMTVSEEELMKVKEDSEKFGLNFNIQKTKIMASGPITLWQIDEETVETMANFIFLGSKINADGDCSHKIKRCRLFGKKVMTNLDSILKNRDITLPTKVHLVKAMVFPVVMYGCESWTIKRAEREELMLLSCGVGKDC